MAIRRRVDQRLQRDVPVVGRLESYAAATAGRVGAKFPTRFRHVDGARLLLGLSLIARGAV